MRSLVEQCLSGLRHHFVAGGVGVALGFGLGLLAPGWGLLVSLGPLLMILLCLVPCLVPLVLLRWLSNAPHPRLPERPAASLSPGGNDPPLPR